MEIYEEGGTKMLKNKFKTFLLITTEEHTQKIISQNVFVFFINIAVHTAV